MRPPEDLTHILKAPIISMVSPSTVRTLIHTMLARERMTSAETTLTVSASKMRARYPKERIRWATCSPTKATHIATSFFHPQVTTCADVLIFLFMVAIARVETPALAAS